MTACTVSEWLRRGSNDRLVFLKVLMSNSQLLKTELVAYYRVNLLVKVNYPILSTPNLGYMDELASSRQHPQAVLQFSLSCSFN